MRMDPPRAIEAAGSPAGAGGRPSLGLDNLEVPAGGARAGFSSWLGRFSQAQKPQRRGSVGFDASVGAAPLFRMDEDSNSGMDVVISLDKAGIGGEEIRPTPFGRKRDISFSELQTPGGDGDTFLLNYKRKQSVDLASSESPRGTITFDHGQGLALEVDKSTLPTLTELRLEEANIKMKKTDVEDMMVTSDQDQQQRDTNSIFLIDLETASDGKNVKLVPKTKKFSVSNFINGAGYNWFSSRNENPVPNDEDAVMCVEEEEEGKANSNGGSDAEGKEEEPKPRLSFTGKLKEMIVTNHPNHLREFNAWAPQGQ